MKNVAMTLSHSLEHTLYPQPQRKGRGSREVGGSTDKLWKLVWDFPSAAGNQWCIWTMFPES